jgi:hypothetical protein
VAWKNIARVILKGPKGAMTNMGQGVLDKVRDAANKFGRKQAKKLGVMGGTGPSLGSYNMGSLEKLWSATGSNGDPHLMAAIAMGESGGNPSADNGIARGLWQIISGTWAAYGKGSWDNAFDPNANARAAHAILAGSGLGAWDAYTNGSYAKYLQSGGLAWGGWHGAGGTIRANRPTLIGIGERGMETATVTPAGHSAGPMRMSGELRITNWKTGRAEFHGIAEEAADNAVNGQRRLNNQMRRMSRA